MNYELLKIIENMGYAVYYRQSGVEFMDEEGNVFTKTYIKNGKKTHNSSDMSMVPYEYILNNDQKIYCNGNGSATITVTDTIHISVDNWNGNAGRFNNVYIYTGECRDDDEYDYGLFFGINNNSTTLNEDGRIGVWMYGSPIKSRETGKTLPSGEMELVDNGEGAVIYVNRKVLGMMLKEERTGQDYYEFILQYIHVIMEGINDQKIKDDLQESIELVTPTILALINDLIFRRDYDERQKRNK